LDAFIEEVLGPSSRWIKIILLWFRLCVEKQSEGFTPRRVKFPGPGYVTITAPLATAVDQFTFYRAR
jgi:hypothetical protein